MHTGDSKVTHYGIPSLAYLEALNSHPDAIKEMLEFANNLLNFEEAKWGVINKGKYKGMNLRRASRLIQANLISKKMAFTIYSVINNEPILCNCGAKGIVVKEP